MKNLCRNCKSDKHIECCSRCGRLVRTPRRDTGFCSLRCEKDQQRDNAMSMQAEKEEQEAMEQEQKFAPEIAICDMGYGFRGFIRTGSNQPWIAHNRAIIFNAVEIERWVALWSNAKIVRYADPVGRSPSDAWPRACSCCLHLHSSEKEAKFNGQNYFCTWCGDLAPALIVVSTHNEASSQTS